MEFSWFVYSGLVLGVRGFGVRGNFGRIKGG